MYKRSSLRAPFFIGKIICLLIKINMYEKSVKINDLLTFVK
ncbi:hypothetical protein CPBP_00414 [Candidatus Bodocaedibacter vickermanii]|uniref:Uncharacterized protein n=1 Tax=Candidatus Bodocaedibacter vickermanii TaxID=2741701 RepID=A0A7L9RSQ3_9PROT|nr:hypothetical protein CPBP_00414 [Candidatus Paracaedibacteraceae bacterium 'Lake Konstanz']